MNPHILLFVFVAYSALIVFQIIIIYVLLEYIFSVYKVTRDVILAAITVYLLLGDVFAPIYMCVELLTRETIDTAAFIVSAAPDVPVTWQNIVYYSFITLTTVGYGDILPITSFARSLAMMQAVIGVLYLAILMARLVGLYAQDLAEKQNVRKDE